MYSIQAEILKELAEAKLILYDIRSMLEMALNQPQDEEDNNIKTM